MSQASRFFRGCFMLVISALGQAALASEPVVLTAPTGYKSVSNFGASLSGIGDVNGDGYDDFAVGAQTWRPSVSGNDGRVWVYFGASIPDDVPDRVLDRFGANLMGELVHGIGDFDGDGYDDYLVGAGGSDHGIYFGSSSPGTQPDIVTWTYPVSTFNSPPNSAPAGDVNGDGKDDFIIGDWEVARVYLFLGSSAPDATPDVMLAPSLPAPGLIQSVSGAGDVNGDGFDDVVVGGECAAYVFYGGSTPDSVADIVLQETCTTSRFGFAVGGGIDINGDGYDDVVVGDPYFDDSSQNNGRVYVYFGASVMDANADVVLSGGGPYAEVGRDIRGIGDLDGDGFGDFLVASATHRVHLFRGGMDASAITRVIVPQQVPSEDFGHIGWAGDLDGDQHPEFLVGAPLNSAAGENFGRAYAFTWEAGTVGVPENPDKQVAGILGPVRPNPLHSGTRAFTIRVTPDVTGPADLELLGVTGRLLARQALGDMEAGKGQEVSWSLPTAAPGVYFIRLREMGRTTGASRLILLP